MIISQGPPPQTAALGRVCVLYSARRKIARKPIPHMLNGDVCAHIGRRMPRPDVSGWLLAG